MLISDLLRDVPASPLKARIGGALWRDLDHKLSPIRTVEDLQRYFSEQEKKGWRNRQAMLLMLPNFGRKSLDLLWPLIEPYLDKPTTERTITMDFEQELQELTDAALEAGVSRVDILAILNALVVTLTGEGALEEEAEHAEEDDQP